MALVQLLACLLAFTCLIAGHLQSQVPQTEIWEFEMEQPQSEGMIAKQLKRLIALYEIQNDGILPKNYHELEQRYPEQISDLNDRFGLSFEDLYMFIEGHSIIDQLPKWKLVLISPKPITLKSGNKLGRYLVYVDDDGNLQQIGKPEDWFEKWIGDAIPGITFNEQVTSPEVAPRPENEAETSEDVIEIKTVLNASAAGIEVKEPTEVAPVEVAEEAPAESSRWWLWLVGLLVVAGGLVLVLRRKS
ncbi:MAG: hypothetical protein ABF315_02295 [Lentimonas sp.]